MYSSVILNRIFLEFFWNFEQDSLRIHGVIILRGLFLYPKQAYLGRIILDSWGGIPRYTCMDSPESLCSILLEFSGQDFIANLSTIHSEFLRNIVLEFEIMECRKPCSVYHEEFLHEV